MADQRTHYEVVVTDTGAREVQRNIANIGPAAERSSKGVDLLNRTLALLGSYLGVSKLIQFADGYQQITNQLRFATKSTQEAIAVEKALFQVSQDTFSSFDANAKLYTRLVVATQNLGTSYKDLIGFIKSVNQAFALSKLSTAEAANSLIQLSQGMAKGVLNGDELRTILESAPILADNLAKGLNTSVGALRKMGETGELTAKRVLDAIQKRAPQIQAEFAKMTPTIGQGWTVFMNGLERFIGQTSQATGAGAALSKMLQYLGNNIEFLSQIVLYAITVWAAYRAALLITAIVQGATTAISTMSATIAASTAVVGVASTALAVLRGAWTGLAIAMGINPFTLILVSLTALVAGIYLFGNAIKINVSGSITLLGLLKTAWQGIVNIFNYVVAGFSALITWIKNSEMSMQLLKVTLTLVAAALVALTTVSIVSFLTTLTLAVGRLSLAFASLLLWPAAIIAAFTGAAYLVAYFTGTVDQLTEKISLGFTKMTTEVAKTAEKFSQVQVPINGTTTSMGALMEKAFGSANAMGETGKAAKEASGHVGRLKDEFKSLSELQYDYIQSKWSNMRSEFVKWRVDTNNLTASFEQFQAVLAAENSAKIVDEYTRKMKELGYAMGDTTQETKILRPELGQLTEEMARAAGAYNYLADSADRAASSISSTTAATSAQTAASAANRSSGSGSGGSSSPAFFATDYSPRWNMQDQMAVSNAPGVNPALVGAVSTWLRKWGGRAVSQGAEFAEVGKVARSMEQSAKDYIKDLGYVWIPGLKSGGQFTVGGSGGPDSKTANMRLSPGEEVTVKNRRQIRQEDNGGGEYGDINVYMTVVTPDADSFNRSRTQTLQQLQGELHNVQRRTRR